MQFICNEDSLNVRDMQERYHELRGKTRRTFNLFSQAVIRVRRHACRHVKDGFHGGGSVVGSCKTCAAIPLESSHEATVRSKVHLRDTGII